MCRRMGGCTGRCTCTRGVPVVTAGTSRSAHVLRAVQVSRIVRIESLVHEEETLKEPFVFRPPSVVRSSAPGRKGLVPVDARHPLIGVGQVGSQDGLGEVGRPPPMTDGPSSAGGSGSAVDGYPVPDTAGSIQTHARGTVVRMRGTVSPGRRRTASRPVCCRPCGRTCRQHPA